MKPGSSVTLKSNTEAAGQKTESHLTFTLKEVTPDKAVIEMKNSMVIQGNKMDMPAQTIEIPKGSAGATPPPTPNAPTPGVSQTTETVKIGDKEYKCSVTEVNTESNGMKIKSKTWTCPEVPNLLVKMESGTEGTMVSKTMMEVEKVELK